MYFQEGHLAEEQLKQRQPNNPNLSFLTDTNHPNHLYYKWRTYSFAQGDSERAWRIEPFQMTIGGPVYIPPMMPIFDKNKAKKKRLQGEESDESKENEDLDYFKVTGNPNALNKIKPDGAITIKLPQDIQQELDVLFESLNTSQNNI